MVLYINRHIGYCSSKCIQQCRVRFKLQYISWEMNRFICVTKIVFLFLINVSKSSFVNTKSLHCQLLSLPDTTFLAEGLILIISLKLWVNEVNNEHVNEHILHVIIMCYSLICSKLTVNCTGLLLYSTSFYFCSFSVVIFFNVALCTMLRIHVN